VAWESYCVVTAINKHVLSVTWEPSTRHWTFVAGNLWLCVFDACILHCVIFGEFVLCSGMWALLVILVLFSQIIFIFWPQFVSVCNCSGVCVKGNKDTFVSLVPVVQVFVISRDYYLYNIVGVSVLFVL
jgi:hypothetical protein